MDHAREHTAIPQPTLAHIDEVAKEDANLAGRLRAARSRQLLAEYREKEREAESGFAQIMMRREKEDRLLISSRVRAANGWAKALRDPRRFQLVSLPADLLSPYGREMASSDVSVAQRAKQLQKELAGKTMITEARERPTREQVYESSRHGMSRVASAPKPLDRPKSASAFEAAALASAAHARIGGSMSSSLAKATVPAVTDNRVVIRLTQDGSAARQLSIALFDREHDKLSRRIAAARRSSRAARKEQADRESRARASRGKGSAESLLIAEAEAVVDARASPMAIAALAAAKARQTKSEVQAQLRRALRETAFLTQTLRQQSQLLKDRGWNAGGRAALPAVTSEAVATLAKRVAGAKAEDTAAKEDARIASEAKRKLRGT